jgi:tetratricopeptide (TPR) repeat protein
MNIISYDRKGNTLSEVDITELKTAVNDEIITTGGIDPRAKQLHEEGRAIGAAYDFDGAILKFEEAINILPDWEYPLYDMAFAYCFKGEIDLALRFFRKTDELKPDGFFETKEAIYALEGETEGRFPKGIYMYYKQITMRPGLTQQQKLNIATEITQNLPEFAPGWLALQALLTEKNQRLHAIDHGLSKNPDETTKGYLLVNKALLLDATGRKEEAIQLLEQIISPESIATNILLAKMTLNMIQQNGENETCT